MRSLKSTENRATRRALGPEWRNRRTISVDFAGARGKRATDDDGSTLLLTIFYGFLALILVLVVVAATSLYLERKRLFTLADGAALAGAEAFELDSVAVEGDLLRPELTSSDVDTAVAEYLATAPHAAFEGLTVTQAASVDGQSATVSLSAFWRPPVLTLVIPDGVPLTVTAVARSVFW